MSGTRNSSDGKDGCSCGCTSLSNLVHDFKKGLDRCSKIIKQPCDKADILVAAVEKLEEDKRKLNGINVKNDTLNHKHFKHPPEFTLLIKTISDKNYVTEMMQKVKSEDLKVGVRFVKFADGEEECLKYENKANGIIYSSKAKVSGQIAEVTSTNLSPEINHNFYEDVTEPLTIKIRFRSVQEQNF